MQGKEEREKQLVERINNILVRIKNYEEEIDSENDVDTVAAIEKKIRKHRKRWIECERELKHLREYEEILENPTIETNSEGPKSDATKSKALGHTKNMSPEVARAIIQLAKAWAADQNEKQE